MKSLARIALVVSLMVSIGGHWGMLQAIAWARMLQDYSAEKGLAGGIKDTFSGERPCPMCLKLRKEKSEAEKSKAPVSQEKTDSTLKWADSFQGGILLPKAPLPKCVGGLRFLPVVMPVGENRARPATPPPRSMQSA
jgi:hypothetical protein